MQEWGVNYWEIYAPVANRISVRYLFSSAIIHKFPRRSIDFVLAFTQASHDVYVFMKLTLEIVVDVSRGEWVSNINNSLYCIHQSCENWLDLLNTGI